MFGSRGGGDGSNKMEGSGSDTGGGAAVVVSDSDGDEVLLMGEHEEERLASVTQGIRRMRGSKATASTYWRRRFASEEKGREACEREMMETEDWRKKKRDREEVQDPMILFRRIAEEAKRARRERGEEQETPPLESWMWQDRQLSEDEEIIGEARSGAGMDTRTDIASESEKQPEVEGAAVADEAADADTEMEVSLANTALGEESEEESDANEVTDDEAFKAAFKAFDEAYKRIEQKSEVEVEENRQMLDSYA